MHWLTGHERIRYGPPSRQCADRLSQADSHEARQAATRSSCRRGLSYESH
ncbi:hypothetical protein PC116_g2187 [Phytophthora cactorum]|nr:hypothetical protein PC114_g10192 [Phytophthora cactorum]KAG3022749.1 hypothetical protein PC120_g7938 [Phytophthora cactorum]KAG3171969.1 hypothetical protein C6341_g10344 [Phytophthora cactorum]KAG3190909.1 hypothetical protein PC128_g11130 [Phytophthora cactorum]KAG4250117.1 hypothetical protein PC116_g2187 [Phytophthora cactorum]